MSEMLNVAGGIIIAVIALGVPALGITLWVEAEKGGGDAGPIYGIGCLLIGGGIMFYIFVIHGHLFGSG